jgi:hypothetical protein
LYWKIYDVSIYVQIYYTGRFIMYESMLN